MRFTKFMTEGAPQPWMPSDPDVVRRWLVKYVDATGGRGDATNVRHDGVIDDPELSIVFKKHMLRFVNGQMVLPVAFERVKSFTANDCLLTNLKGAPSDAESFAVSNNMLTSLEGLPKTAGKLIFNGNPKITSLHGINRIVTRCEQMTVPVKVEKACLGLLLIRDLLIVRVLGMRQGTQLINNLPVHRAFEIIGRHLKAEKDVLACQEELIDNDLEEFAQL